MSIQVSFVLISYNSSKHLSSLLPTLEKVPDSEVVILENASGDSGLEEVIARFPFVKWIRSDENLGFGRGMNRAVQDAIGDFLFLLNPDTSPTPESLVAAISRGISLVSSGGIYSASIPSAKGNALTYSAGFEPTVLGMAFHMFPLKSFSTAKPFQLRISKALPLQQVDWVSGASMFMLRSQFDELDGFSTRWFMYGEDIELCHRVRVGGSPIFHDTTVEIPHEIGGSAPDGYSTVWLENLYDYYRSTLSSSHVRQFTWRFIVKSGFAVRALVRVVKPNGGRSVRPNVSDFAKLIRSI